MLVANSHIIHIDSHIVILEVTIARVLPHSQGIKAACAWNSLNKGTEYRLTEARLLGFSYDFGVAVICHQNADAM